MFGGRCAFVGVVQILKISVAKVENLDRDDTGGQDGGESLR